MERLVEGSNEGGEDARRCNLWLTGIFGRKSAPTLSEFGKGNSVVLAVVVLPADKDKMP
jgi:hypothetical protein